MSREDTLHPVEIDEDEWILLQVLENPVLFREFINEYRDTNDEWNPLEDHERAWSTCEATYQVFCCGRSVHKTTAMIELLYWWVINDMFIPGEPGLFVLVPNKAQKDLPFFKIMSACTSNWLLKYFVDSGAINKTEGTIIFLNGFQFMMRIAGAAGNEGNVIGVHTSRIWVDEGQAIPYQTWLSLQNSFKREIRGSQMIVSGVPNGGRHENVLYECDNDEKYVQFNVSQTMMSTWTLEREYELRDQYHALVDDTEDYKHYVLGQHGLPSFSVFDRARFSIQPYDVREIKQVITQHLMEQSRRVGLDGIERFHFEEVAVAPPLPIRAGQRPLVGVGYDVGYSVDPTVFLIMIQNEDGTWRNLVRYVLQHVEYPIQTEFFAWLDRSYSFNFIGIDMGGPGKTQYQYMVNERGDFKDYRWLERIYPVEFGAYMTVAIDEQGEEKKDQVKRVAVEKLSQWVHEKRFVFAKDDSDLMEELERTKFTRTLTGESVYRTENDHQMAALMCAIMANENKYGIPVIIPKEEIKPHLISAKWLDPLSGRLGI